LRFDTVIDVAVVDPTSVRCLHEPGFLICLESSVKTSSVCCGHNRLPLRNLLTTHSPEQWSQPWTATV